MSYEGNWQKGQKTQLVIPVLELGELRLGVGATVAAAWVPTLVSLIRQLGSTWTPTLRPLFLFACLRCGFGRR